MDISHILQNPIVNYARDFAKKVHGAQTWTEGLPYVAHLDSVAEVLLHFAKKVDFIAEDFNTLVAAAYLHDVVEDTNVTITDIDKQFGLEIALLVNAVANEPGKNRKERHDRTYPKILNAGVKAVTLKFADRIANFEKCIQTKSDLIDMYQKEGGRFLRYFEFCVPLEMYEHLKSLHVAIETNKEATMITGH